MCHISPRFIKEVEDRIRDNLVEGITGEVIDLSVEMVMKVVEDMDIVEVVFGEEIFKDGIIFEVEIIIEQIEIGKIGEHGVNPGQEKEIELDRVGHHLVQDWDQALLSDRYMRRSNAQMDQWSILCDSIVYVKSKDSDIMNGIDIKSINYREHKRNV